MLGIVCKCLKVFGHNFIFKSDTRLIELFLEGQGLFPAAPTIVIIKYLVILFGDPK